MPCGKITGLSGSWGSGLASLSIRDDGGDEHTLYADSGPLVRALDAMFECIRPGHIVDADAVVGQYVQYAADGMLLVGLEPA